MTRALLVTMPLLTKGFNTAGDRLQHWGDHHADFEPPPCSETDYEARADRFLGGPKPSHVLECPRTMNNGKIRTCRYDPDTNEYGVLSADGRLLTYFKPKTAIHRLASNEYYFHHNCD